MTVSAPKHLRLIIGIVAISVIAGGFLYERAQESGAHVSLDGKRYSLLVARTDAEREQGLSGRANLPAKTGMIFEFDTPGTYCFWMKDMHFNIDMVWLDSSSKVIKTQQNAIPESYPSMFCPPTDASWVLELPAGTVKVRHIDVGGQLKPQSI